MIRAGLVAALLALGAGPAGAEGDGAAAIRLSAPLDCSGGACFIQQYVDRDPGPGARDFTCGPLSYDGHRGTDFTLPSHAAMRAGVTVRAAAPGTVRAVRDGMPDAAAGAPDPDGRDCGNGVVIDHAGGWQTQYCHLKRGSVRPRAGAEVGRGAPLGEVGLSGRTAFPHLHLTLRRDGDVVDPFAPDTGAAACDARAPGDATLWADPVPYRPGGIIRSGVATAVPEYDAIKDGLPVAPRLAPDAPALVIWTYIFGGRDGDRVTLRFSGPDGVAFRHVVTLSRTQAQLFRAAGRRMPPDGWPAGTYSATATLRRDEATVDTGRFSFAVGGG